MTKSEVCYKFKFGVCKFKERCIYRHVTLVCDDYKCDVSKCEKDIQKFAGFTEIIKGVNLPLVACISMKTNMKY